MENPFNTPENTPKRSTLLTVLLVLTFIGSGFTFLAYSFISLAFDQFLALYEVLVDEANETLAPMYEQAMEMMEKTGPMYYGIWAALSLISLIGAGLMWNLRKVGLHFYAAAQIILLFIPMIFGIEKFPGLFGTLITALFIWLYIRELGVFKPRQTEGF